MNKIYLVISSLAKRTRTDQEKVFARIKMIHKRSKEAATKNFFFCVYVIDAICFDKCFMLLLNAIPRDFLNRHNVVFFELKEVCILHYLHNNNAVLIP